MVLSLILDGCSDVDVGPGERVRVGPLWGRCTPVVWTGAAAKSSVKPPNALSELRALRAPGLANNCARGMAEARGPAPVVLLELLLVPCVPVPVPPSRLAFCSSTLRKERTGGGVMEEVWDNMKFQGWARNRTGFQITEHTFGKHWNKYWLMMRGIIFFSENSSGIENYEMESVKSNTLYAS